MSTDVALAVDGVWKQYDRQDVHARTLKQFMLHPVAHRRQEGFWALSDVNLRLHEGETVGLIGANGAGKSTLLRLVAGLGKPTRGRIVLNRQPQAILTIGDTFDPVLTGRENAVTAAIVAGFTRKQARRKLDEIVAFAELEDFIDQPLRMYSSGMMLRLAFAVASSIEPEILLLDEVLSVGDIRFQSRCAVRLAEFQRAGTTILLASHDESQVSSLCRRVIWLSRGGIRADADPESAYKAYRAAMRDDTERRIAALPEELKRGRSDGGQGDHRFGTLEVEIVGVRISPDQLRAGGPQGGQPFQVELDLEPRVPVDEPVVAVSIHRLGDGQKMIDVNTQGDGTALGRVDRRVTVQLDFDHLDLEPGSYYVDVGVYERAWAYVYDYRWKGYQFNVGGSSGLSFGPARRWSMRSPSRA